MPIQTPHDKESARRKMDQTSGKKVALAKEAMDPAKLGTAILYISVALSAVFFMLWIFSAPDFVLADANHNLLSFAMMSLFGPVGIYTWYVDTLTNRMEEKFAEFLLDLSEYWKVGLSMTTAIETIAQGEYGALNKEVKRMATQISWGVAFNDVLLNFRDRIKTKIVARSVSLILEANRAGGRIADVLVTAAKDVAEIKWLQKERQRGVAMYIWVIYISFFVYLAVIAIIVAIFLPAIIEASSAILESEGGGTGFGGIQVRELNYNSLVFIFYCSVIVQSVGNGMMAGIMGEGNMRAGLKHVFIMSLIGWVLFRFFIGFHA